MNRYKKPYCQRARDMAYEIGQFYLIQNDGDYQKAESDIRNLQIVNIECPSPDKVSIYLSRPGLLIGRKGNNFAALQAHLNKKIHIVESFSWNDILVPYDPFDV